MTTSERKKKLNLPAGVEDHLEKVYTDRDWVMIDAASDEGWIPEDRFSGDELWNAYHRGVISKKYTDDGTIGYVVSPFDVRMECMIQCEYDLWQTIQGPQWEALRDVMMDPEHWMKERIAGFDRGEGIPSVVKPVEEAEKLLQSLEGHFFSFRCNCNAYIRGCQRDKSHSCIHVQKDKHMINSPLDRGLCQEISREEAIAALHNTDEIGLVHTIEKNGMCNCCVCCCYTLSNMDKYNIKDHVLLRPYRAKVDEDLCIGCSICVQKCMFGALKLDHGKMTVNWDLCLGCGVCRRNCRKKAISMIEYNK